MPDMPIEASQATSPRAFAAAPAWHLRASFCTAGLAEANAAALLTPLDTGCAASTACGRLLAQLLRRADLLLWSIVAAAASRVVVCVWLRPLAPLPADAL